ncbi:11324_t:CDS:1, partial [Paraglomus occultum]
MSRTNGVRKTPRISKKVYLQLMRYIPVYTTHLSKAWNYTKRGRSGSYKSLQATASIDKGVFIILSVLGTEARTQEEEESLNARISTSK